MPSRGWAGRITTRPMPISPISAAPLSSASTSADASKEPTMIKAIRFAKTGGPEVLEYKDYDLPAPGPGQVRVKHTAIGVNFIDIYHRSGLYPLPMPSGLGSEAAGVVEAVGAGVTGFKVGERVGYCSGAIGAYADANNVAAEKVVK